MLVSVMLVSFFFLMFDLNMIMSFLFLTCLFLLGCMFFPNLSFFLKIESTLIFSDKLSFFLFMLTIFSFLMIFMSNFNYSSFFSYLNKILLVSLIFVYFTLNFLLFYFFFEITIIPTIMLILVWGYQPERLQASFYFFFYTILASLPLLIFVLFSFTQSKTNFMIFFHNFPLSTVWWSLGLLAFLVKFPMFFFHLWLPKAHVEAPLGGSMILAAVLLKLGGIGIFRLMTMFKNMISSAFVTSLSAWGMLLTTLICLQQSDLKAMIAYSSVAHMSFLISSMFLNSEVGINGAILMMIFHGFSSAALFMLAKLLYNFTSSRSLILTKGKMNLFPIFTLFWALMIVVNMAMPPASSFWSEILLLMGVAYKSIIFFPLFFLMAFFSTIYSCFLMVSTHHGKMLSKMNFLEAFNKSNFCPMLIFVVFSYIFFLCPSVLFV